MKKIVLLGLACFILSVSVWAQSGANECIEGLRNAKKEALEAQRTFNVDRLKVNRDLINHDSETLAADYVLCKNVELDPKIKDAKQRCIQGIKAKISDLEGQAQCYNALIKKCGGAKKDEPSKMCVSQESQDLKSIFGGNGGQNTSGENKMDQRCRRDFDEYLSDKAILDDARKKVDRIKEICHYSAAPLLSTVSDGPCRLNGTGDAVNNGETFSASTVGAEECLNSMVNVHILALGDGKTKSKFAFPGPAKDQCSTNDPNESYLAQVNVVVGSAKFDGLLAQLPCPDLSIRGPTQGPNSTSETSGQQ